MYVRKRAFTLVELLVVVAIIALLISILLPALGKAKREGRRVVCMSNLHQIAVGVAAYTADARDLYPSEPNDGNDVYNMVWEWGGMAGSVYPRPPEKRLFYKYIYPEFFRCSDDRGTPADPTPVVEASGTSYPLNAWNWNGYRTVFPKSYGRIGLIERRTNEVTNPKCLIAGDTVINEYWADLDPFPGGGNPGAGLRCHDLEKPRANVAFIDGSASFVLINPSEKRVIPSKRSYWWWEGKGYTYSFCPTNPAKRFETPWYQLGK